MKKFTKITIPALLMMLPLFTSCESEPEVGSLLYPVEETDYSPMAYISNKGAESSISIKQLAGTTTLEAEDDSLRFKVQLTNAAPKDLTFNIKVDNSKLTPAEGVTLLNEDVVISPKAVTIQQGMVQSEDIVIKINKTSQSLIDLNGKGVVSLSLVSNDGVRLSKKYSNYVWNISKELTYIDANGTSEGKERVANTEITIPDDYGRKIEINDDGVFSEPKQGRIGYNNATIKITLAQEQEIKGFELLLPMTVTYWGDWKEDISTMTPGLIEVYGGVDQKNMVKLGEATRTNAPKVENEPFPVMFVQPVKAKYINIVIKKCIDTDYSNVYVSGFRLYK